ncbi:beta-L-arabinofuranosidase domain-containing protein [Actinosynnema sp. NPDC091369]
MGGVPRRHRVDRALTRFFAFTARQPDAVFSDGWGATRWGDAMDVVLWLYNRTGDTALLDLTRRIHRLSADWTGGLPSLHNVNIAQGFREPAQFSVLSGDDAHRAASYRNYDTVMARYGQFPGGGFAGDENARPGYGDPRQGFETCGVVEYMGSHELLTRLTGDAVWADRTEDLAFNLLPAALDPSGRVAHYVTPANAVRLDDAPKRRRQFQNGFAMLAYKPGVDQYRCCPHNYGQGWPYVVEEMWLATDDGGVAAALYGPSAVTGEGRPRHRDHDHGGHRELRAGRAVRRQRHRRPPVAGDPGGPVKIQNLNSTKVLAVDRMSTADSARVVQFADVGTADHRWQFLPDADGCFRIRNAHSGKVLGVDRMSTADSAIVVQFSDTGTADHLWQLRAGTDGLWRIQNGHSGKVLGVDGMSYADSAQVVQFGDTGTPDHLWRLLPA